MPNRRPKSKPPGNRQRSRLSRLRHNRSNSGNRKRLPERLSSSNSRLSSSLSSRHNKPPSSNNASRRRPPAGPLSNKLPSNKLSKQNNSDSSRRPRSEPSAKTPHSSKAPHRRTHLRRSASKRTRTQASNNSGWL